MTAPTRERIRRCRCGETIEPAGSAWIGATDGWETCLGREDFHEPADIDATDALVEESPMTARERTASVTEAAAALTRLIRAAEDGQTITITRQGRPVARLVPYGVAVDELETFQALMDEALQRVADARDFGRRHATTPTTPQEDQ